MALKEPKVNNKILKYLQTMKGLIERKNIQHLLLRQAGRPPVLFDLLL